MFIGMRERERERERTRHHMICCGLCTIVHVKATLPFIAQAHLASHSAASLTRGILEVKLD